MGKGRGELAVGLRFRGDGVLEPAPAKEGAGMTRVGARAYLLGRVLFVGGRRMRRADFPP